VASRGGAATERFRREAALTGRLGIFGRHSRRRSDCGAAAVCRRSDACPPGDGWAKSFRANGSQRDERADTAWPVADRAGHCPAATPLDADITEILARLLGLATICLLGWTALTALHIAADLYLMRFRLDVEDNLLARKHVTQVRVLQRVLEVVIVLVTVGFALMTFDAVRQFGVTLFASAGVAGIVAGLAARPVLSNFLAGVQLAVAQPIRIDDAVIVENESGNIEEITFSYVVVKLWDLRRLVVPLSYFIEKPFQNWTRTGGELIGTVFFYVDHTAPVDVIRNKVVEIVSQSKLWNGKVVSLQVSDCKETTIELRALVSANNASATWDLRCEVREKLIEFLQREYPSALPRRRYETAANAEMKSDEAPEIRAARGR
jgi:small-conductance mechanosensitive channel